MTAHDQDEPHTVGCPGCQILGLLTRVAELEAENAQLRAGKLTAPEVTSWTVRANGQTIEHMVTDAGLQPLGLLPGVPYEIHVVGHWEV
jgi:hypothetical protein